MERTPISLLQRLRQSPTQQDWQRFIDLYTPLFYFWARRLGLQPADAADLVQEVFTAMLEKLPEFNYDRSGSFPSWLRTVTRNKWCDSLRRRAAALRDARPNGLEEVAVSDPAEAVWEEEYGRHLTAQALELIREEFQPTTWKAFWGLVVESKSAAELAKELGLLPNAIYAAKARVLRRLRAEFADVLD